MNTLMEGAKAYEVLARRAEDPQEIERYLDGAKQLKNLDKMLRESKINDRKFAHGLQPGIDASISLAKTTENDNNRIIYNNITHSLQNLQNYFLNTK